MVVPLNAFAELLMGTASFMDALTEIAKTFHYGLLAVVLALEYLFSADDLLYNAGAAAIGLSLMRAESGVTSILLTLLTTDWTAVAGTLLNAALQLPAYAAAVTGIPWIAEIPLLAYVLAGMYIYDTQLLLDE